MPINSRSLIRKSITAFSKDFGLSRREEQTFRMIILEQVISSLHLSKKMNITDITARTHCKNIFRKCGVTNKAELAVIFLHYHTKLLGETYGIE